MGSRMRSHSVERLMRPSSDPKPCDTMPIPACNLKPVRLASIGMNNTATISAAMSEVTTVRPRSLNTCPASPSTNTIGKNTQIDVSVEAITAPRTSFVPRMAALRVVSPSSRQR